MTDPLEQQLDEWLEGALDELGDDPPRDQEQADRLLRAAAATMRRLSAIEELADRRIAEIMDWRDGETAPLNQRMLWLEKRLRQWALAENERTGRKTWKLPAGDLKVRPRRPRTIVTADDPIKVAGHWRLLGLESAVHTTTTLMASEVKKRVEPGDLVAGYPAPDGYEARYAMVAIRDAADPDMVPVPGVVLLVPKEGREGLTFQADPKVFRAVEP